MLQNATSLRKSAPGPPNISDKHASCTALATENASLHILFQCPTPGNAFETAAKPSSLCFVHFDFEMCFATTACIFSTSQLAKVVPAWCVLYILTSKCASRHNVVQFFDISTSKSGPRMVCFVHFDFEMCFAPQRRALFRHRNFQQWSKPVEKTQ